MKLPPLLAALAALLVPFASSASAAVPEIGAEVWIEPGQTPEQIDRWFETLERSQLSVARLFLMWNYVETAPGQWDFSLYDRAFAAAAKHHVKIVATLTANHGPAFADRAFWYRSQGGRILQTHEQLALARTYLQTVVRRYKDQPALACWWLQNEPGQLPSHEPLALERYRAWLAERYKTIGALNAAWLTAFPSFDAIEYDAAWDNPDAFSAPELWLDWNRFWRSHMTWYLQWIATEVRAVDAQHDLHVNPHGLFDLIPKYELPRWTFLSSLGASIHPSWHFGLLQRDQYACGVAATCDMLRGALPTRPIWVSELQGGNNLWSGTKPLCPTPEDIAQWVWTGIGSGAQKVIFWSLNVRAKGGEAGEWGLLDFQDQPSERLVAAQRIAATLAAHRDAFAAAQPVDSGIAIVLGADAMTIQARKSGKDLVGRHATACQEAALTCYLALQERGVGALFVDADAFDWERKTETPRVALLPNVIALADTLPPRIEQFVRNGNVLIVTGLTGYFDASERATLLSHSPLETVLGGNVKEFFCGAENFNLTVGDLRLPVHLWHATVQPTTGTPLRDARGEPVALRNRLGAGGVFWCPAMIDLGARTSGNIEPLGALLVREADAAVAALPFRFEARSPGMLLRTLKSGRGFITVLTNNQAVANTATLVTPAGLQGTVIFGESARLESGHRVKLEPRETIVVAWQPLR